MNQNQFKLLALCDNPTGVTGFGQVARELLTRFRPWFAEVDVWAINYHGAKYDRARFPFHLFPASGTVDGQHQEWFTAPRLTMFLNELAAGGYTHVWLLNDPSALTMLQTPVSAPKATAFPQVLKKICAHRGIRSLLYFPVDAPMEKEWGAIIDAVDVAVAYTHYGRDEAQRVSRRRDIQVQPHGVNLEHFHPLELPRKPFNLTVLGKPFFQVTESKKLLLTVAALNRRKDLAASLRILRGLLDRGVKAFWFLHAYGDPSQADGVDLRAVARQLKLEEQVDWSWTGAVLPDLQRGLLPEEINAFYNAADMLLSTTLGEGWGLPLTEALAAGCPVAAPAHTAVLEIMTAVNSFDCGRVIPLPHIHQAVVLPGDNARLRPVVDVPAAVRVLAGYFARHHGRRGLNTSAQEWLDWSRIAEAWRPYFFEPLGGGVDAILQAAGGSRIDFAEASGPAQPSPSEGVALIPTGENSSNPPDASAGLTAVAGADINSPASHTSRITGAPAQPHGAASTLEPAGGDPTEDRPPSADPDTPAGSLESQP